MKMNKQTVLALAVVALGIGAGAAHAAISGHTRSRPAHPVPSASSRRTSNLETRAAASITAGLGALLRNGAMKPDPKLHNAWRPVVRAAAGALGLPVGSLRRDLSNGESLAAIASRQGLSPAAVARAIERSTRAALARAVADGTLSATARADILELLQAHLKDVLRSRP